MVRNVRKKTKRTKAGKKIEAALQEILDALDSGKPLEEVFTVREVEVPDPKHYNARAIREIRAKLGMSQPVFAKLVGISTVLEQKWEQGTRFPDGTARRLLDEINRDPKYWASMIVSTGHN